MSKAKVFEMLKEFLHYQGISIKEGLHIESEKSHFERYDKTKSRKCKLCGQVFIIKKKLKNKDKDCNQCFKITNNITKTGRMYIIWKENVKYRVYINLYRTDADHLMKKEENLEKYRSIDFNKYVESLNSFFFGDTNA